MFSCGNDIASFCLSFVLVLGDVLMDKGIKSGKSSSLGMAKASQAKFKDTKKPKLGDAPGRHPLFRLQSIGNITWSYIFIHHMICVLLGASCIVGVFYLFCCVTIILAVDLERERHELTVILSSFTYIFW